MQAATERLNQLKAVFQLTDFQLAYLFGVDRSALRHWRANGIPHKRLSDIEQLETLANALLRSERSSTARTIMHWPHASFESRTPLQVVRALGLGALCETLIAAITDP